MYRLSLKRLIVMVSAIGLVFGFMPTASAHKNTETVALVTGIVQWPAGPKADFDLNRGIASWNLSLDLRADDLGNTLDTAGDPLNGCRLKDGNSGDGLPTSLYGPNHDLCFLFDSGDLTIQTVGLYENIPDTQTDFNCISSGTSGASGGGSGGLGAFYGEFTCDADPASLNPVPIADGHFHGQSVAGGLEIGFLGEVDCDTEQDPACPRTIDADPQPNGKPVNESRIKHTLSCKGGVHTPTFRDKDMDGAPDTVVSATVELECVIA